MDSEELAEQVEKRTTSPTPIIYGAVRQLGEDEMDRPAVSLWWSGFAAGLSISFSLLAQANLAMHLPDAPWRHLVVAMGYPVGFLIVVLSRQQLFTENTITVILPVLAEPTGKNLGRAARLWGIVLAANLAGTLAVALFLAFTPAVPTDVRTEMLTISRHTLDHDWVEMGFLGIISGYLMATLVWLIPSAGVAQFHIVFLITYLIAQGEFTHIVAGSVEAFLLLAIGEIALGQMITGFTLPVLAGNIVGGTALFALISYAQVMREVGNATPRAPKS
ncbi:MAG: formate/nitrite transporter family protein [Bacteroidota bacterium]